MNRNILNPYILRNNYFYELAKLFVQNLLGCTTSGNQCKDVTRDDSDFFLENCLKLPKSYSDCDNNIILLMYEEKQSYIRLILSQ